MQQKEDINWRILVEQYQNKMYTCFFRSSCFNIVTPPSVMCFMIGSSASTLLSLSARCIAFNKSEHNSTKGS